jgi:hypothetical protein
MYILKALDNLAKMALHNHSCGLHLLLEMHMILMVTQTLHYEHGIFNHLASIRHGYYSLPSLYNEVAMNIILLSFLSHI